MHFPRTLGVATLFSLSKLGLCTDFLNHTQLLAGLEDPAWFEANVPILDVPDGQIQQIYYYRWSNWREHLFYTSPQYGFLSTEFLPAYTVGYACPYYGIVAAAGHHIVEGRWLRDPRPGQDIVNFWLAGPGNYSKPANDGVNADTTTWATEYSFWAATSVWRQFLVTGNQDFATGHLQNLVWEYLQYNNHFNSSLGLYWQAPVWDATEYTAASYNYSHGDESGAYHGGVGYRPTINSYQYGDAQAIAALASLSRNSAVASEYTSRASSLQNALTSVLWDNSTQFFKHRQRDNNPTGALLIDREIMGFLPWTFNVPLAASYSAGFSQLQSTSGFSSPFGPTTTENRSHWFEYHASYGCCHWDGPSWPFATSQTLTAVENLLNDYPAQKYVSASDYYTLLRRYASTQYKNGNPYVAEAHNSYQNNWMYDSACHSEDYNHSTFIDNIISGLLGLRPQSNDSLIVNPLIPSSWDHFCLENAAYHGHNVTVLWDNTGNHYNQGQGLRVYVDNQLTSNRTTIGSLTVPIPTTIQHTPPNLVNIAVNSLNLTHLTLANASFTSPYGHDNSCAGASANNTDNPFNAIDGNIFRQGIPENTRWTTYASSSPNDSFTLDLRRPQAFSNVHLYFYSDDGGVQLPASYSIQSFNSTTNTWSNITGQSRTGNLSVNAEIRVTFPQITTQFLRIVAPNRGGGTGWGLSEIQIWSRPIFQIRNLNSNLNMAVLNASTSSNVNIVQNNDYGGRDRLWLFTPAPGGWFKIQNMNSGKLLSVQAASTADSAQLQQADDNGSDAQLWRVEDHGANGQFFVRNKNSGLLAGVDGESRNVGADVVQFHDNGTPDHLWLLLPAVPAN